MMRRWNTPSSQGNQRKDPHWNCAKMAKIEDFYNMENLKIQCKPRCGGCMGGRCSLGSDAYTIKEEKELA